MRGKNLFFKTSDFITAKHFYHLISVYSLISHILMQKYICTKQVGNKFTDHQHDTKCMEVKYK